MPIETGLKVTACATTHSVERLDFREIGKWAAIGGLRRWHFVSAETNFTQSEISGELSLWPEFAVPDGRVGKRGPYGRTLT